MARRELEEINAGSMADIAFLLLIFFIVTTTMDLEAGIPKTLPMKVEIDPNIELPDVRKRDIFSININAEDNLLIEGEAAQIKDLGPMLAEYYTANMYSLESKPEHAEYILRDINEVRAELAAARQTLAENEDDIISKSNVSKLEKRLNVCEVMPDGKFMEIHETAAIQLKQKAGTSYGRYIEVQNEIGKTVNEIKTKRCKDVFNGLSFADLDPKNEDDQEKLKILDILVPSRLLEPEITN